MLIIYLFISYIYTLNKHPNKLRYLIQLKRRKNSINSIRNWKSFRISFDFKKCNSMWKIMIFHIETIIFNHQLVNWLYCILIEKWHYKNLTNYAFFVTDGILCSYDGKWLITFLYALVIDQWNDFRFKILFANILPSTLMSTNWCRTLAFQSIKNNLVQISIQFQDKIM